MVENERRSYDAAINEIAINVNTVMTRQEDYIKQIDTCAKQTGENALAIGSLKTKMGIVTYIGSGAFIVTLGALVKKYLFTHPPGT